MHSCTYCIKTAIQNKKYTVSKSVNVFNDMTMFTSNIKVQLSILFNKIDAMHR